MNVSYFFGTSMNVSYLTVRRWY
uniref:Uncharacterized protein n=1 Tax=Medicago truncatula TaxID=3880 RepID=I3S4D3_MEDTR|nr:unknown [Medicago truncatula]